MSVEDVNPATRLPDPYMTAMRGMEEELGIHFGDEREIRSRITFHSLICDVTRYEWALLGHVNLTRTKWTDGAFLNARKFGMGADDWESSELSFVPLTRSGVIEALKDDSEWVGHGYVNLLLSAMHRLRLDRAALLDAARSSIEARGERVTGN